MARGSAATFSSGVGEAQSGLQGAQAGVHPYNSRF